MAYTTKLPVSLCIFSPFSLTHLFELANTVHQKRPLMYWAKASLFKNPIAAKVLYTAGVIPVDRGAKDNHKLFAGTFKALSDGDCVALFPEGTSYTMPRIVQFKDGASWAVLEYMKWVQEGSAPKSAKEALIVPVGITYTDKSKYRSSVVIEFVCFYVFRPFLISHLLRYGKPIHMEEYREQFMSAVEGEPRLAVKRLTHRIEQDMVELTVNAPDWETLLCGQTARNLLWDDGRNINLDDFRFVSQT
jgi:glycerol-3-phosphate O-acyltransferase / dihydroxyacetone phosphate acyltransferase